MSRRVTLPAVIVPTAAPVEAEGMVLYAGRYLRWLRHVRGRAEHTCRAYARDLSMFTAFCAGRRITHPSEVRVRFIEGYLATIHAQRGLKASSVNRALYAIQGFFRYLRREEIITDNPAADAYPLPSSRPMPKYLSVDEQTRVLAVLAKATTPLGVRNAAVVALALGTGLRVAELVGLDVGDLDLAGRVVKVRHAKGDKWRHVGVPADIVPALARYLRVRETLPAVRYGSHALFVLCRRPTWALGAPLDRQRLTVEAIREMLKRKVAPVVGRQTNPHQLRHSYASRLREHGAPLQLISESLGHADLSTTAIYAHLTNAQQRADVSTYWTGANGTPEGADHA